MWLGHERNKDVPLKFIGACNFCCFHWSKISSTTCDCSDAHFSIVRRTTLPIRICAVYYKSFFFVNLVWSKSQYVYSKQISSHILL